MADEHNDPAPLPPSHGPIGVFDSGVGGLTVVHALQQTLPHESIVYLGDTARVPWGSRSGEVVRRYAKRCAQFLIDGGAKMLVVACNTASAYALADLQAAFNVPVLGVIEAGASLAASHCPQGKIGVVATEGTVSSHAYQKALGRLAPRAQVMAVPCPLLVPLCEENYLDHPATKLIAQEYLATLAHWPAQAVVLGCTHYPLLLPLFVELLGPDVRIIDSATAVAQAVQRALKEADLEAPRAEDSAATLDPKDVTKAMNDRLTLYATDVTPRTKKIAARFLQQGAALVQQIDL